MDNITARIGNNPMAILGAERVCLLLLQAIQYEIKNGTPMTTHEIEESIRCGAETLREHYDALNTEAR